jgi:uncharacterized membrane protein
VNEAYLFWKTAHVISAAILFGTGLGIAFFAWSGYRRAPCAWATWVHCAWP